MTNTLLAYRMLVRAVHILDRCIQPNGVWADPKRYRWTIWTRDTALAIFMAFDLLDYDFEPLIRHYKRLAELQGPNGKVPIVYLDDEQAWVAMKEKEAQEENKTPFMLRRYREDGNIHQLTPGTRDSEVLYVLGVLDLFQRTKDMRLFELHLPHIELALGYVERELLKDGLIKGCDWRDTMEVELGEATLLTNNCILHDIYRMLEDLFEELGDMERKAHYDAKAYALFQRMEQTFWNETWLIDRPGHVRVDPLGTSLAILRRFADDTQYEALALSLRSVDSPYGVTIKCKHSAFKPEEKEVIERTGGVVVWPWIMGYTILAALEMGDHQLAKEQYGKWLKLGGFAEWYDPQTGKGHGAPEQLWSATLFIAATIKLAEAGVTTSA